MTVKLKRVEPGHYTGSYRGVDFAVKKDGHGVLAWRIHQGETADIGHGSRDEAVRSFAHYIDLEMMAVPPEVESFLRGLAESVAALQSRLDPNDAAAVLQLSSLAWDLRGIDMRIRQDISIFQARLRRLEKLATPVKELA